MMTPEIAAAIKTILATLSDCAELRFFSSTAHSICTCVCTDKPTRLRSLPCCWWGWCDRTSAIALNRKQIKFSVLDVSNLGVEGMLPEVDQTEGTKLAKVARTPANHMVCIEVDGDRVYRWDRDGVEGENLWKKTDRSDMEMLGPIRQIA